MYSSVLAKENKSGCENKLRKHNLTGKKKTKKLTSNFKKEKAKIKIKKSKHSNLIMITSSYMHTSFSFICAMPYSKQSTYIDLFISYSKEVLFP